MLHQDLPPIESTPLDGWDRWLAPLLAAAAGLTAAVMLLLVGQQIVAALALVAGIVMAVVLARRAPAIEPAGEPVVAGPDYSLVGAALGLSTDPVALTDGEGALLVVNAAYRDRFGSTAPLRLAASDDAGEALNLAKTMAWRDGAGCVTGVETNAGSTRVEVDRVGTLSDLLLWRFPDAPAGNPLAISARRISGSPGVQLAAAGVLAAVVNAKGEIVAANSLFADRAVERGRAIQQLRFADLVEVIDSDRMRLVSEGEAGRELRVVHVPAAPNLEGGAGTFMLFDTGGGESVGDSSNLQSLLDMLPIGLALVDRDGRFLTMNGAFRQAAGLKGNNMPVYPGDLVMKEDKAAVADAVRRNARGPAMSGDLAVRLTHQGSEPVALTIAGLRGLGDAAVLLLLKDNSEEAKLKRQVAQATKMQMVGQLAGGVAHDFNNILTAIIGHCELMLMRHTPGDSD